MQRLVVQDGAALAKTKAAKYHRAAWMVSSNPNQQGRVAPPMKHIERHHSKHAPVQLFDLVIDVDAYPGIVPWVIEARVLRRKGKTMWCEMAMGTRLLRKHFTTVAELQRPDRVEINSYDPMFERFEQIWTFTPTPEGGTDIACSVEVTCRSRLLQALLEAGFAERTRAMVNAYMGWAERLYGNAKPPR